MVVLTFASKTVSTCCFIVLKGQTLKDVLQIFKQLARQKLKFKMGKDFDYGFHRLKESSLYILVEMVFCNIRTARFLFYFSKTK
jgi:hypothetical protein